jgi:hypothetical protein
MNENFDSNSSRNELDQMTVLMLTAAVRSNLLACHYVGYSLRLQTRLLSRIFTTTVPSLLTIYTLEISKLTEAREACPYEYFFSD